MSEIADYQTRITAALERVSQKVAALKQTPKEVPDAQPAGGDDALKAQLEAERESNAQLTERVAAIKSKQETTVAALEAKVAKLTAEVETAGVKLHRHKRRIGQLADINRSLREAVEKNVSDPALVNKALQSELDAMRAAREAEVDEIGTILTELAPLVGSDAPTEGAASEETADA